MYFFFSGKLWSGAKGAAVFLCGKENGEGEKIYVHKSNEFCRNRNWDFWIIWTPGLAVTQSFFCFRICCEREEKKHLILPNSPFQRALNQKKILSRLVLDIWSLKKKKKLWKEHFCSDVILPRLLWAGLTKWADSLSYIEGSASLLVSMANMPSDRMRAEKVNTQNRR